MKKILLLGVVSVCVAVQDIDARNRRNERRLKAAIVESSVDEVENLLKKHKDLITEENKKEFLDEAQDRVDYYETNTSVLTAKKDAVSAAGGLVSGIASLALFLNAKKKGSRSMREHDDRDSGSLNVIPLILGGVFAGVAFYLGKKGFSGETRKSLLDDAETIVALIKEKAALDNKSAS